MMTLSIPDKGISVAFRALLFFFILTGTSSADEIFLENGDRLTGTVKTVKDGVLTLKTQYSEPIKINTAVINKITSDNPLEIHLTNGEILKGKITPVADKKVKISASPKRTSTVVDLNTIKAVNPPEPKPVVWHGGIAVSASNQSGNAESSSLSVGGDIARRSDKDRISLRGLYNYGEDDNVRNTENIYAALKYDYFMTKAFYTYLAVEALKDTFKDLKLRTTIGPGVGYQVWDDSKKSLSLEVGVSYFNEDREIASDEDWLTARSGVNFRYDLFDRVTFTDLFLIYPSLEESSYKLRNEAAVSTELIANWSLNLTNIFEYDSDPAINVKNDDITWLLGLLYSF